MASGQTSNYGLNQWQASDKVLRTEFNADNQKTDTALKGLDSKIDTSISGVNSTINAGLAEVESRLSALEGKMTLGSYVGNGKHGLGGGNQLTFPKRPTLVLIFGRVTALFHGKLEEGNSTPPIGDNNAANNFSWSGNTLSWFNYSSPYYQLNEEGLTYYYLAFYL